MEVTIEEKATFDRELKFVLPSAEVDRRIDQELARLATTVRLPGFRPGKIPRKILESRFKDHLTSAIAEEFFRESFPEALTRHNLNPVDQPELSFGTLERGREFSFTANIQIFPTIEPTGYTGLSLSQPKVDITGEDIDRVLGEIQSSHGRFDAVPGREAVTGDQVVMDFEGFIDGAPFAGGKADKYVLELGSGQFIPGFEDQLLSARGGDRREVKVTFPSEYGKKELAGKDAVFQCTVHEVRVPVKPEIDDELARKAGVAEGGLVRLREMIRERLEQDVRVAVEKKVQTGVHEALLKANVFEIPSRLEERQRRNMLAQMKRDYQAQGIDVSRMGLDDARLLGLFGDSAGDQVRLELLLARIADKEKVEVDETRVEDRLNEMTLAFGDRSAEVRRMVRDNRERMDSLRHAVLQEMVIEWIVKNSTVTQEPCTLDELMGGKRR
ncbi:MAG: trigger factor [Magnetococcales bacterium]|nr:trigger factor [Magnetococcales bacterium]